MKNFTFFVLTLAFFCLLTFSADAQSANLLDPTLAHTFESFTGSVTAVAKQPDGKILVGGYFLMANTRDRFGLARFNPDGTLDETFNAPLGVYPTGVRSIVVQPDGKILVGGLFVTPSSQGFPKNIVRLNANGSEDTSFAASTSSAVYAIVLQPDGKVVIGGTFTSVNSVSRFGLARLNTNGTLDTGFTYTIRTVFALALQPDGSILVGGNFALTSPNVINRIIRVTASGTLDTAFSNNAAADNNVLAIKVQSDGKILLGGMFASVNGVFHNSLARLNSNGTLDNSFNPSVTAFSTTSVESLDIDSSGRILVGGNFTDVNGSSRSDIARLNPDGSLDTSFAPLPGAGLPVRAVIAENDGSGYIGGDFLTLNGAPRFRFAKLNPDGSVNSAFNAAVYSNGNISEVEIQPDGKILAGGSFFYVDGTGYGSIVRFNADGTIDNSFATFAQSQFGGDPITDIELQADGKIIITGTIYIGSNPQPFGVVRLNANGTIDNTFTAAAAYQVNVVKIAPNGQILIGGDFTTVNNTPHPRLARLNSNGSLDSSFNPNVTSNNFATVLDLISRSDGKILIGGVFETVNGTAKSNIALLNSDGTLDNSFTATASNTVAALAQLPTGSVLLAGSFSTVNGTPRNRIAKISAAGELDTSFNVDSTFAFPNLVIKPYIDGRIILAGQGNSPNSTANTVVVLNSDGSTNAVLPNNQRLNNGILDAEVQSDGKVVFGGYFTQIGNTTRFALARFTSLNFTTRSGVFDFDGDSKTDISIFRPSLAEWWINRSQSGQTIAAQFGASTDKPVPADFTGDRKTDIAFWRGSTGEWFILRSEDGSFLSFPFGTTGDIPLVGDFDGDGKADPSVFRPSNSTWYISKSTGGTIITTFGAAGDVPVPADYDGDGKTDVAIYRPSNGQWWIQRSTNNTVYAFQFGTSADKPVQGDYTGDGKADSAFFRPSTGEWFILRSEDSSFYSVPFGANGDLSVPGDYDGDGKFDTAVFRPSNSTWYANRTSSGLLIATFGTAGDQPVPNVFVP